VRKIKSVKPPNRHRIKSNQRIREPNTNRIQIFSDIQRQELAKNSNRTVTFGGTPTEPNPSS